MLPGGYSTMGPPPNAATHLPSLMPGGMATLKKTRCLNAQDYRNGGQMPIAFDRAMYVQQEQGERNMAASSDGYSSEGQKFDAHTTVSLS